MKTSLFPSVSIVMPTLNSSRTLEESLSSIRDQDYPQNKIEILIVDGGSVDDTKKIADKYNCKFIKGGYRNNQEARRGLGLNYAKGEIIAVIDSDNILPNKDWFKQMVSPLLEDKTIVGSQTLRYGVKKDFPIFNRYCALFGFNDPVAFYLKRNEKLSWLYDKWSYSKILKENDDFLITEFSPSNLPTVGCNGFFIWKELLLKSKHKPNEYFHIDVVLDLIKLGYTKYALVKNEIYHSTATTLKSLAIKRLKYFIVHNPSTSTRRYLLFDLKCKKDIFKLGLFIFFAVTLVQPLFLSVRGFIRKRDMAWFLHPVVCICFLFSYVFGVIFLLAKNFKSNLHNLGGVLDKEIIN